MQALFFAAGLLALITGVVHSVFGEILIFRHLRSGGLVPAMGAATGTQCPDHMGYLASRQAGVLLRLALAPHDYSLKPLVVSAIVFAYLGGSLLVLVGTRGRHPGWIALLVVAVCTWAAAGAA